ncbi:MAG: 4-hydroxythreonine-4-phosphate dehydrogenase PdxA [Alphaproteobacteria bacterium]|nr:4-hydroxythreonine-4-phosphate dehydrogenase PdxA [Alphaproteobacteria bacterium]
MDAILIGDAEAIQRWSGELTRVERVQPVRGLALLQPQGDEPVEVAAIRVATRACLRGEGRALVTGPIHKARLAAQGFHHPGHTDFLGELCGVARPVMGFVGGELRVVLVTVHVPLAQVAARVTQEGVGHVLRVADQELRQRLGIARPRLLVCGLNPHAGDEGLLGREEIEVIGPGLRARRGPRAWWWRGRPRRRRPSVACGRATPTSWSRCTTTRGWRP